MLDFLYIRESERVKLKLESQEGVTILCVTEDVLTQHAAILKAGITKLFKSGKKVILLDMTGITSLDEGVDKEILNIQAMAPELDSQLVVASPLDGLGQAPTRELVLKQMSTALFGLMATEAKLQVKLKRLEKQKLELNNKLNSLSSSDVSLQTLRKENSDLKTRVRRLERQICKLMNSRVEPKPFPMLDDRMDMVNKTLSNILGQDGVVSVT